jgi:hypothetical protein
MKYTLSIGGIETLTIDTQEVIERTKAKLEASMGNFLQNKNTLFAIKDKLALISKTPDPALQEPVRIAIGNLDLLNKAQDTLQAKAQAMIGTFGLILTDIATKSKATVIQRLLTSNVYGSRFTTIVTDSTNLGLQMNAQNTAVKKLGNDVTKLETAAKGQGLIPSIQKAMSPLMASYTSVIKYAGLGLVAVAVLWVLMPRKR